MVDGIVMYVDCGHGYMSLPLRYNACIHIHTHPNVGLLDHILYCITEDVTIAGELVEGYTGSLYYLRNFLYICNYFKVK